VRAAIRTAKPLGIGGDAGNVVPLTGTRQAASAQAAIVNRAASEIPSRVRSWRIGVKAGGSSGDVDWGRVVVALRAHLGVGVARQASLDESSAKFLTRFSRRLFAPSGRVPGGRLRFDVELAFIAFE